MSRLAMWHLPWAGIVLILAFILAVLVAGCATIPPMEPLLPPQPPELKPVAVRLESGPLVCVTPAEANALLKFFLQLEAYADTVRALNVE